MKHQSDKNLVADKANGRPRSGIRLTQGLLIAAVLVLIVIAAVQFS